MAWRIADNVVRGELDNRTPGLVQGKIWLAGREAPLGKEKETGRGHKGVKENKKAAGKPGNKKK